ncbi:stromal processing peptidase, chloroplastic-like [Ananas comosus]|uniref:Stromal processing peptidase, chloroplastic-like n=1 Tax=Ananas comosus TaxID=4615 RepID=A0A6P5GV35_ANACO|nr:stromal processing peptidase, chloroplastic-like [Ananas comosus]
MACSSAAPHLCSPPPRILGSEQGRRHRSSRAPSVALPSSAAALRGAPSPLRSTARLPPSPVLPRCLHVGGSKKSRVIRARLDGSRRQNLRTIDESVAFGINRGQLRCFSCFQGHRRNRYSLRRCEPSVFSDKSSLPCQKLLSGRKTAIQCAALGPEEPHVASTTWSEGILEKQGLPFWDPEAENTELDGFLSSPLPTHPKLHRGQLKNGLRYIILPNKTPPNRFEAHMEVHVGSIDEEDDEQGIAHMIEHVAFLGSKKREKLLGTGARSNAYTDFHHTVFHIHSPTSTKDSDEDLLPFVLDALNEVT